MKEAKHAITHLSTDPSADLSPQVNLPPDQFPSPSSRRECLSADADRRVQAGQAAALRNQLAERDLEVLRSLYDLRLLRGNQLQRLHVPVGSSPSTTVRRTNRLLKKLHGHRLAFRLKRRVGGVHAGSSGYLWGITGLGQAVIGIPPKERHRVWRTKPYHQDHMLACSEFYVRLVEITRERAVELVAYQYEYDSARKFSDAYGPATLKPDGFVHAACGEHETMAFIEIDMDTTSLAAVGRKCQIYIAYYNTGLEQRRHDLFPRVYWLVPDAGRQQKLRDVIRSLRFEWHELFVVALQAEGAGTVIQTVTGGEPPQGSAI